MSAHGKVTLLPPFPSCQAQPVAPSYQWGLEGLCPLPHQRPGRGSPLPWVG